MVFFFAFFVNISCTRHTAATSQLAEEMLGCTFLQTTAMLQLYVSLLNSQCSCGLTCGLGTKIICWGYKKITCWFKISGVGKCPNVLLKCSVF